MTTTRAPLTDAALRSALLALAAGPDAGQLTTDVLRQVAVTPQVRRLAWPVLVDRRRLVLVGLVALLTVALIGALISSGVHLNRLLGIPDKPLSIVVQQWNRLAEPDSRVTHTAWAPGAAAGVVVAGLPANAISVRWSPDGGRVVYFDTEITVRTGGLGAGPRISAIGVIVADADGTNQFRIPTPHSVGDYPSHTWFAGAVWAPDGQHFALPWSTGSCSDGPDCVPPAGIDVFDRGGKLVVAVDTPGNINIAASWSADGRRILWTTGTCVDSSCMDNAVHWRALDGNGAVTSFDGTFGSLVWTTDDRIKATSFDENGTTGVLTMALDGSDVQPVPWDLRDGLGVVWSPDGEWLGMAGSGFVRVRNDETGVERTWPIRDDIGYGWWSPDGRTMVLIGEPAVPEGQYGLYAFDVETGSLTPLGDGVDFGWMPAE